MVKKVKRKAAALEAEPIVQETAVDVGAKPDVFGGKLGPAPKVKKGLKKKKKVQDDAPVPEPKDAPVPEPKEEAVAPTKKKKKTKKTAAPASLGKDGSRVELEYPKESDDDEVVPPKAEATQQKKKRARTAPDPEDSGEAAPEKKVLKKTPKAKEAEVEPKPAEDGSLWVKCMDCDAEYLIDASEQEFLRSKGFENPKRCKDCRWAKKQRNEGKGKDKGKGKGKDKGKDKGKGKGKDGGKGGGGGVCYKFQQGNCRFTDCKFSHA